MARRSSWPTNTRSSSTSWGPLALGGSPILLDLDVDDVDGLFERAVAAGATPVRPPDHPTAGVQAAKITDPFGHVWLFTRMIG